MDGIGQFWAATYAETAHLKPLPCLFEQSQPQRKENSIVRFTEALDRPKFGGDKNPFATLTDIA